MRLHWVTKLMIAGAVIYGLGIAAGIASASVLVLSLRDSSPEAAALFEQKPSLLVSQLIFEFGAYVFPKLPGLFLVIGAAFAVETLRRISDGLASDGKASLGNPRP